MKNFGIMPDGTTIPLYKLTNNNGMTVEISGLGGAIINLNVPDSKGSLADVALAHAVPDDYFTNPGYFGVLIGRNSNRIADAVCDIASVRYELAKNDGDHNLHSDKGSLCFRLMNGELFDSPDGPQLRLTCRLEHLSDGFPGNLDVTVTYTLTHDNAIVIDYEAVCDADTIINLTNHTYFNLAGHDSGSIKQHKLTLDAPFYCPNDKSGIPTGELLKVEGTPFDMRHGKKIGDGLDSGYPQIELFKGYDHNFILAGNGWRKIGKVEEPVSGRYMEIFTTQSNVQLYTHNLGSGTMRGKDGTTYSAHQGFCLETQTTPNAARMPWLISPIYKTGQVYKERTAYCFGVS